MFIGDCSSRILNEKAFDFGELGNLVSAEVGGGGEWVVRELTSRFKDVGEDDAIDPAVDAGRFGPERPKFWGGRVADQMAFGGKVQAQELAEQPGAEQVRLAICLELTDDEGDLRIARAEQAPVVDIGRSQNHGAVVDDHQFGMDVDLLGDWDARQREVHLELHARVRLGVGGELRENGDAAKAKVVFEADVVRRSRLERENPFSSIP